jgi:hypothetical protein
MAAHGVMAHRKEKHLAKPGGRVLDPTVVLLVMATNACRQMLGCLESLDNVNVLAAQDCRQVRRTLTVHPRCPSCLPTYPMLTGIGATFSGLR